MLAHVPPAVPVVVNWVVVPGHPRAANPFIVPATANGFTVIDFDETDGPPQPVTVYVMLALPAFTPVTTPEFAFTMATLSSLLDHVPLSVPVVVNGVIEPAHTDDAPPIVPAFTVALTTIGNDALNCPPQPVTVYVIVALPAVNAVTTPLPFTIATAVLLLVHAPPIVPLLLNDVADPAHTDGAPLIVPAITVAFTVIDLDVLNEPQPVTE